MWLAQESWSVNFVMFKILLFMFKILFLGTAGTLEPGSNGRGGRFGGGGGEAAGGRGKPVKRNFQS